MHGYLCACFGGLCLPNSSVYDADCSSFMGNRWRDCIIVHLSHHTGCALIFSSDCFDTCLIKTYKAFIAHSKFVKPEFYKHIQFLRNSFVELCSLDVEKSIEVQGTWPIKE